RNAAQKVGSTARSAKFRKPTQLGGLKRFHSSSDRTPAATTGPAVKTTNPTNEGSRKSHAATVARCGLLRGGFAAGGAPIAAVVRVVTAIRSPKIYLWRERQPCLVLIP